VAQETQQTRTWADRGWYLALEFGPSNSDRHEIAVRLARRGPGYLALLDENRALVHRNLYRRDDNLRHFWRLLDHVRSWKSARFYFCGDPVTADEAAPGVECYLYFRKHSLCEGAWGEWPMFIGCPNAGIALRPDLPSAWFRRSHRSGRVFAVDKTWLSERLESGLLRHRCCPLLEAERVREMLHRLPAEIDPARDRRWRVDRRGYAPEGWHELRPAGDDAYADYLAEVLEPAAGARR
jgi:hypothetical protein